ncbi:hypothetical protein AB0F45_23550 [Streptomyces achromogenes]|uniref:hypothetical protein n=1 Tax=Streptomyces achromogenes TaxID=67255 RepID=UPI002284AD9D|nr:hypothetical protein [Streptomyces sp. UMAF16]
MNEYGTSSGATPVEERLRAALAARAHAVGPADLRPLSPPAGRVRSRRTPVRRAVVGGMALAAVAALVFLTPAFFTTRDGHPAPTPPARSPHPSTGTPSPAPTPAVPSPVTPTPTPRAARPTTP